MIQISIHQKGARAETIKQLVESAIKSKYPEASVSVTRKEPAESRSDRFSEAQSMVSDAKSEAESLRDELQDWHDNLPEQFQNGEKGEQLNEAISQLEEFISACDTAEGTDVEFPQMY